MTGGYKNDMHVSIKLNIPCSNYDYSYHIISVKFIFDPKDHDWNASNSNVHVQTQSYCRCSFYLDNQLKMIYIRFKFC